MQTGQERTTNLARDPKKYDNAFVLRLHKSADAQRKLDEERQQNPVFRRKASDTTRESSIEFWKKWH